MDKLKEKLKLIHKWKLLIFLAVAFFAYFSYIINAADDHKGFMFVMMAVPSLIFIVLGLTFVFIDHIVTTVLFLVVIGMWVFTLNALGGTTDYIRNKVADPCYKEDNLRYLGKGPWEYQLNGRTCVGIQNGNTIIFRTKEVQ